ncbi:CTTNBP2 N-terminal-like protein isoform X2 [Corythoichthys intestinalis]|uniref:CTTNBP2 N-terminal-like protein isoform X2 n=1 Tax=Corythoichthys intestinalis TaxID=161448 RepID=UPI0025A64596|nr:CTTNBP2 N-terminal-like protein isoform X2 [Corythoichthys intestinalis]
MKEEKMNVEALSRAELLTLLSILEGELEAQEVVIHAFRAQHKDSFVQERYGQYNLSDPFLALQRDSKVAENQSRIAQTHADLQEQGVGPNPLAVLKLVMAHCKRMQERMMRQLAATESRHKKLEIERAAVRQLERAQEEAMSQAEDSLTQHQQLSSTLSLELQKASTRADEEAHKVLELRTMLQEETGAVEKLQKLLEEEKNRSAEFEAENKRKLAEFTTEQVELKARLINEEFKSKELRRQLEHLKKRLAETSERKEVLTVINELPSKVAVASTAIQTEPDGKVIVPAKGSSLVKVNGHHTVKETDQTQEERGTENVGIQENGAGASLHSPLTPHPHNIPQSPSSTASSSLSSSPISSPVLVKHLNSPGFHQSSYQAGVNQRFQAARHKFQTQAELEQQQHGGPLSPRDLSPTTSSISPPPEHSAAKQLARNTVTQVLSRFTSQQAGVKLSNSPFGTDYRNVAVSPPGGRSPSGHLSPGIRSPLTPRSERTHPPPIPPKKPGISQTPGSPSHSAQTSLFPELSGNCGPTSCGPDGTTEAVLSSTS